MFLIEIDRVEGGCRGSLLARPSMKMDMLLDMHGPWSMMEMLLDMHAHPGDASPGQGPDGTHLWNCHRLKQCPCCILIIHWGCIGQGLLSSCCKTSSSILFSEHHALSVCTKLLHSFFSFEFFSFFLVYVLSKLKKRFLQNYMKTVCVNYKKRSCHTRICLNH